MHTLQPYPPKATLRSNRPEGAAANFSEKVTPSSINVDCMSARDKEAIPSQSINDDEAKARKVRNAVTNFPATDDN